MSFRPTWRNLIIIKIKDGFTVLSVTSSVVEKSHPLISFNSLRPLRFGRGDHILLTDHQTLVILPIPHIPYIRQPYTSYVISTNAEKSNPYKKSRTALPSFLSLRPQRRGLILFNLFRLLHSTTFQSK